MKNQYSLVAASLLAIVSVNATAAENMDGHNKADKADKMEMMVQKYDMNKDGQISKEEFVQYSQQKFDSMDTDKNGALSMAEFQSKHADKRDMMKK